MYEGLMIERSSKFWEFRIYEPKHAGKRITRWVGRICSISDGVLSFWFVLRVVGEVSTC